jgi:pimeloyl-ACP methyl ester carboxylesterase
MQTETILVNIPKPAYIDTNGIKLHVMQAGDKNSAPVLMLHGFPEFWYAWHDYITPLSEAGYRVILPDQRGYNLSDKPEGSAAYRTDILVDDMIGLMDALGHEQVRLVGHDWGAIVAWYLAMWYPERIEQLVIANVPHPKVFKNFLKNSPKQMLKSWYAGMFQIPVLPEMAARANNWQLFANVMREVPGITEREVRLYQQAWSQPGAMTAMINWYRAMVRHETQAPTDNIRITVPTLMLWGQQDFALSYEMAIPSIKMCDNGYLIPFPDANHFVQHEKSEEVTNILINYFSEGLAAVKTSTQTRLRK